MKNAIELEISLLGSDVEYDAQTNEYRSRFRGFTTPWRAELSDVLKDVEEGQKPIIQTI